MSIAQQTPTYLTAPLWLREKALAVHTGRSITSAPTLSAAHHKHANSPAPYAGPHTVHAAAAFHDSETRAEKGFCKTHRPIPLTHLSAADKSQRRTELSRLVREACATEHAMHNSEVAAAAAARR